MKLVLCGVFMLLAFFGVYVWCGNKANSHQVKLTDDEAIRIAVPAINQAFPGSSSNHQDYSALVRYGIWLVSPNMEGGILGGGPSAEVDDFKKNVLRTFSPETTAYEAVQVAIPAINHAFPGSSSNHMDYRASFRNGAWFVSPNIEEGVLGGGASAVIDDTYKSVLRTYFSE